MFGESAISPVEHGRFVQTITGDQELKKAVSKIEKKAFVECCGLTSSDVE